MDRFSIRKLRKPKKGRLAIGLVIVLVVALGGVVVINRKFVIAPSLKTQKANPTRTTNLPLAEPTTPVPKTLFFDALSSPDGIVTNEYSHYNSTGLCPHTSAVWEMTSGTLLIKNGAGYSGVPTDEATAVCESSQQTDSATFRLNTKANNFRNVKLSVDYQAVKHGGASVATSTYDGMHIWVGYQNEYALYAVSVFRWDGVVVIKKKVPVQVANCTDVSNDGCYYNLSSSLKQPATVFAANVWHHADIDYSADDNGYTTINLVIDGRQITKVVDKNNHGPAYPSGAVGVRGDNTEFYFKNFKVTNLN